MTTRRSRHLDPAGSQALKLSPASSSSTETQNSYLPVLHGSASDCMILGVGAPPGRVPICCPRPLFEREMRPALIRLEMPLIYYWFADTLLFQDPVGVIRQLSTRQVHNLAIDPLDETYFVSAGPGGEPIISLWDRRGASRSGLSDGFNSGPVLEYKNAFESYTSASIWCLRFSGHKRGSFAALTNAGILELFETASSLPGHELSARPSNSLGGSSWSMPGYTKRSGIFEVHLKMACRSWHLIL